MPLHSLHIQNFRNVENLHWDLAPGLNVLEGENAQGKTNLLEVIYLLANGRSFRTKEWTSLIRFQQDGSRLRGTWEEGGLSTALEIQLKPEEKIYYCQGKPLRSLAKVHEFLRALVFTPDSSSLFRVSPQARRRYFDQAVELHQAPYGSLLRRYQRILRQRNQCLEGGGPADVLQSFDAQWAEAAHQVWLARAEYLQELLPFWKARFEDLSGMPLTLSAQWSRNVAGPWEQPELLQEGIRRLYPQERRRGRTLWGPHRDDLKVQFSNHAVREVGSQGQQRILVIALKLAEADLFRARHSRSPIFLLDDLGSELDEERQSRLIRLLAEIQAQTVLTTTRASAYRDLAGKTFHVKNGKL